MDTSFQRTSASDEWYTPPEIIASLGKFDLDPCAAPDRITAARHFTKEDDGLSKEWSGRVWLNPPYSQPLLKKFITKMALHANGIALLFNRCDNALFHDLIFPSATAMLFLRKRIRFYNSQGLQGNHPGCGSVLIAWGEENALALKHCTLQGKYVSLNN